MGASHLTGISCTTAEECLAKAKNPSLFAKLREQNITQTKKDLTCAAGDDIVLVQGVQGLDELNNIRNTLLVRLREWYGWYVPELVHQEKAAEAFVAAVISGKQQTKMGIPVNQEDLARMQALAQHVQQLLLLCAEHEQYIIARMKTIAPNVSAVATPLLGAKLLVRAGSLKRLSRLPASTVQLLGAEKALFRHMTTGAKNPKYGILYEHPLVQQAKAKGKAARVLADKIAIAARIDYFKGSFIGEQLLQEVKKKL